jgi:hypothetical protein
MFFLLLLQITAILKQRMMVAGTLMVGYQPLGKDFLIDGRRS